MNRRGEETPERVSAGSGHVGPRRITLKCGHTTVRAPAVTGARQLWFCPDGCGLQERRR